MKIRAEMGKYSSVVGQSVHLLHEDGRMAGQIIIMSHVDEMRDRDRQHLILTEICDAINGMGDI